MLASTCPTSLLRTCACASLPLQHLHPEKYASLTGLRQIGALRFAHELREQNIPFWLRYVLIPGHTDDKDGIKRLAEFAHQHQPALQVRGGRFSSQIKQPEGLAAAIIRRGVANQGLSCWQ